MERQPEQIQRQIQRQTESANLIVFSLSLIALVTNIELSHRAMQPTPMQREKSKSKWQSMEREETVDANGDGRTTIKIVFYLPLLIQLLGCLGKYLVPSRSGQVERRVWQPDQLRILQGREQSWRQGEKR